MSNGEDRAVIEIQVGRPLRAGSTVVARCHLGLPVVVQVPPLLDDGTPFPTLFWLTCPLASTRIGRIESSGGVRRMEAKAGSDARFGAALAAANADYAAERDAMIGDHDGPVPTGGVGGSGGGIKCLHAHYAHHAADRSNPVGELVASWIEPLDCVEPCVADGAANPKWVSLP